MVTEVAQLSSQVGRNDFCPCGSGKKYKKCCLPKDKEKERLKRELENIKDITDKYCSAKEYIEQSGHPVIMIDYLLLEILNIIGEIIHAYYKMKPSEIREIIFEILKEAKRFYVECQQCEYICLSEPMRKMNFKSLFEQGLKMENFPKALQNTVAINFFYFELLNVIIVNFSENISKIIPEGDAEPIIATVHHALHDFVSDNCWNKCSNKCMKEHSKNAYCSFCSFGDNNLPCPQKGEITFTEIKAKEEDMLH